MASLCTLGPQCFFAGEWIVNSFEPKAIAYVFVFAGLWFWLRQRFAHAGLALALASYFHILVGGWIALAVAVAIVLKHRGKHLLKFVLWFGTPMIPFLGYLFQGYFLQETPTSEINLNWVYCYFRLPNHLGIVKSIDFFLQEHAFGVVASIFAFALCWRWRGTFDLARNKLNLLVLIMLAINLCFVVIAFADHFLLNNSGGLGLKYYPFRTSSLALFLFIILLYSKLQQRFRFKADWSEGYRYLVIALVLTTLISAFFNIRLLFCPGSDWRDFDLALSFPSLY